MQFQININNFNGGYAPNWWKSTYPFYGNSNMAGAMQNCDLTNPNVLTQGPGLETLASPSAVSTLIKGLLKAPTSSDISFGIGGNLLYEITSTTTTIKASAPVLPHIIDHGDGTAELGEDVAYFQGNLYYSFNYTTGADVGKYDLTRDNDNDFDDDWLSTTPTGNFHIGAGVPHQLLTAGNDVMYIANGRYVSSWDGTTTVEQALDLPTGSVITSLAWANNRLWIAANRPNLTGTNNNTSSIFSWDGNATSWDDEIIVGGLVSALYVRNGIIFVFYADITSTGGYKLGYVNGTAITDLANFTGALPSYYQVSEYQEFLIWNSNGLIWAWGSGGKDLPTKLFQLADGGYATVGGVSSPFGTPLVASSDGSTVWKLAKFSGYDVASNWKSLLFDLNNQGVLPIIDGITINFEGMSTGASVGLVLRDDKGIALFSDTISYAGQGTDTSYYRPLKVGTNNVRIEFDWATGSATNAVKIRNIRLYGSN